MNNRFGQVFTWTSFGESHGVGLGVVIDGCPAGVPFDKELLQKRLNERRPGQKTQSGNTIVTARDEKDQVEVLSGVFEGFTLGTPIAMVVKNKDARPKDYEDIKKTSRVGHADDLWKDKYGHSDHRGGGRSSGRETVSRVMAGAVAEMLVKALVTDLDIYGFSKSIGEHSVSEEETSQLFDAYLKGHVAPSTSFSARFPTNSVNVEDYLLQAKTDGESYGGVAELWVKEVPKALGSPMAHKLKNDLASAMMSVGATCGVEFGDGFSLSKRKGTEVHQKQDSPVYGGLRGGMSTGAPLCFRVAFKPTSSITDVAKKGRHDPCIVPRAIAVLEAMTYTVLADHLLMRRLDRLS